MGGFHKVQLVESVVRCVAVCGLAVAYISFFYILVFGGFWWFS